MTKPVFANQHAGPNKLKARAHDGHQAIVSLSLLPATALILQVSLQHHSLLSALLQTCPQWSLSPLILWNFLFAEKPEGCLEEGPSSAASRSLARGDPASQTWLTGPAWPGSLSPFQPRLSLLAGTGQALSCPGVLALGFPLPGLVFL